jgi:FtsZ-binding cell division protein ZapB
MSIGDSVNVASDQADATTEIEERLEFLHDQLIELECRVDQLEKENKKLREDRDRFQERLNAVDARTDVLNLARNAENVDHKQRRAALLLNLKRNAEKKTPPVSTLTQSDAETALQHPDIDRTTYYNDFRKLEQAVGNKHVLEYVTEGSGSSHLKLDLRRQPLVDQDLPGYLIEAIHGGE